MHITLVIPVFNEQDSIPLFYKEIKKDIYLRTQKLELIFINDGSSDNTETILELLKIADQSIKILSFTRNFGKEAALMAGLEHATGDIVIPIDVDLQDPLNVIPLMVEKWKVGASVVLAKRVDRSTDSYLKRKTASMFYQIHNKISSPSIEENVGDFRLLDKSIVDDIKKLKETNLFMKGILSWVGGKVEIVEYTRQERVAGNTKFNMWKLWNLALEGITSFSTVPLRIWTYIGSIIATLSFIYGIWIIYTTLLWGNEVKGYPSLLVCILFFGGIQLIGIGVLGEYVGRIYIEVKNRPRYILKKNEK